MLIQQGRANVIIDGQWGSSGKGKLAGYLYDNYAIDVAVCDYMPNAGHTVFLRNGKSLVFRQLPVGAAYINTKCLIGPHAAIDVALFNDEMDVVKDTLGFVPDVTIHPLAVVIRPEDRAAEQRDRGFIATTAKGGHAATTHKIMLSGAHLAMNEPALAPHVNDTQQLAVDAIGHGKTLLVETAQGFDLGLNHGWAYPYVTGRDCMVGRALDNAGVPVRHCGSIIGCLRTFPIRVGNTEDGESGPCYADHSEIGWDEVSASAGCLVKEMTTVTKRVRRVFGFSWLQLARFMRHVQPTHLFLNFVNYLDNRPAECERMLERIATTARLMDCELTLLGTGKGASDMELYQSAERLVS